MFENFSQLQIQAAFKQDQNQGERTKARRCAAKNVWLHPVQCGADEHTGGHQDDNVGHVREAHQSVGDESQHQKAAKDGEKERKIHSPCSWPGKRSSRKSRNLTTTNRSHKDQERPAFLPKCSCCTSLRRVPPHFTPRDSRSTMSP